MKLSPLEYYNLIAEEYNEMLSTDKDIPIRKDVEQYITNNITANVILDFGGGTGMDINWLSKLSEILFFYEPAEKMNDIAKKVISDNNSNCQIINLSEASFNDWQYQNNTKLEFCDLILMNFGVINYIDNLNDFFSTIAKITSKNADLVVNILLPPAKVRYTRFIKSTFASLIKNEFRKASSVYKGNSHETKLYKLKDIESAAKVHFKLIDTIQLGQKSDFHILHFKKG